VPDQITFDRAQPLFRLFEQDEGPKAWWTVEADNAPGRPLDEDEISVIEFIVNNAPWKDAFFAALAKNKKATVYENVG
jgi:hypothetical protein